MSTIIQKKSLEMSSLNRTLRKDERDAHKEVRRALYNILHSKMRTAVFRLGTMHYHEFLHTDENYLLRSMNIQKHQTNLEKAPTAREGLLHAEALIKSEK